MTQADIIQLLKQHHPNRYTAKQLSKMLDLNTPNISKALKSMRHYGLVRYEKVIRTISGTKHTVYVYWCGRE